MSTYPPTECGIATFTTDLMDGINKGFSNSIRCLSCDLTDRPKEKNKADFTLNPKTKEDYITVAEEINKDPGIKLVHIQHEFGLFGGNYGNYLLLFLATIKKPVAITFHSVLPNPNIALKSLVKMLVSYTELVFVMTKSSELILKEHYGISENKITYVPHGTHVVDYTEPIEIKKKFNFEHRMLLSTFGLLSPGKSIETALMALPQIIEKTPNVLYLVIGKTHPNTIKNSVDNYRAYLMDLVESKNLKDHVMFIDRYLKIDELLDYLKASDIYLFTSKDPNQAVSGTFTYAMSCSCPMVATTIPHTAEVLTSDKGILVDIENPDQLANAVNELLENKERRESMAINAYQKTRESSWENVAIKHFNTYEKYVESFKKVQFNYPPLNLSHLKNLTTPLGVIQFSKISKPDISSGYTLDDNARALIVMCLHYSLYHKNEDLSYIHTYLSFIERCQQPKGDFINYIDEDNHEHIKNSYVNLEDSNARAVWALGTVISFKTVLPESIINRAKVSLIKCFPWIKGQLSPRSIGFSIKGLYLYYTATKDPSIVTVIEDLAKKLISNYDINAMKDWRWFEEYLTYANGILPEAMLYAYLVTGKQAYRIIAVESFDFLLSKMFHEDHFKVISNNGWYRKDAEPNQYGEQPIDVAYTIEALDAFNKAFDQPEYKEKMEIAFNWFLGKNQLNQIMYNPIVGGCFDGLEQTHVNLNQGAESTICFLMARLLMEKNMTDEVLVVSIQQKKKIEILLNAEKLQMRYQLTK